MFMKCHDVGRADGHGILVMVASNDIASTWEDRGDIDLAREFWERALQIRRDLGALRIGYVHGTMSTALLAVARTAEQLGTSQRRRSSFAKVSRWRRRTVRSRRPG
jgi:hypothetical protein